MTHAPLLVDIDQIREHEDQDWTRGYMVIVGVDPAYRDDYSTLVYGRLHRRENFPIAIFIDELTYYPDDRKILDVLRRKEQVLEDLMIKIRLEDREKSSHPRASKKGRTYDNPRDHETRSQWRKRLTSPHGTPRSR